MARAAGDKDAFSTISLDTFQDGISGSQRVRLEWRFNGDQGGHYCYFTLFFNTVIKPLYH